MERAAEGRGRGGGETLSQDIYDPAFVKGVFDRCSSRYIGLSWLFSFGFTERWRRQCVAAMPAPHVPRPSGYDLMAGTGEVWPHLLKRFPDIASIQAVDISSGMHRLAMERLHAHRAGRIAFLEEDVLANDLPADSADFVVSTFGLKTFSSAQHARLARQIARCLKPGGVFSLALPVPSQARTAAHRAHPAVGRPGFLDDRDLQHQFRRRLGLRRPAARARPGGRVPPLLLRLRDPGGGAEAGRPMNRGLARRGFSFPN
jgi:ubiquinone/menaquinone biosynthesis C-methylase UbiE